MPLVGYGSQPALHQGQGLERPVPGKPQEVHDWEEDPKAYLVVVQDDQQVHLDDPSGVLAEHQYDPGGKL